MGPSRSPRLPPSTGVQVQLLLADRDWVECGVDPTLARGHSAAAR
ncbi:hypothetical protein [Caudoviricetes sp.]|nr:hypothetical protein [Caudoviricetes sp.]